MKSFAYTGYKFRERLRELLKENNITQAELATSIGVTRRTVNSWLNNKQDPSRYNIMELAKKFRVLENYLTGEVEYRSYGEKFDNEISLSERANLSLELNVLENFVKHYELEEYSIYELTDLHDEIIDFIEFKVKQFKEKNKRKDDEK